jgi:hypothetical protein
MSTLYDAQGRGFPDAFTTIDRAAEIASRLRRQLAQLDAATGPQDMGLPG